MGAWGVKIFEDDLALDVRGDYRDLVIDKSPDAEAEAVVLEKYLPTPPDEDTPTVWIALGLTQHEVGRLSDNVRDEALRQIESGEAEAAFRALLGDEVEPGENEGTIAARRKVLVNTAEKLRSPQPKRKALRPPLPPPTTNYPWVLGRFYGFRAQDFCAVMQVQRILAAEELGHDYLRVKHKDFVGEPLLCLKDWFEPALPGVDKLDAIPWLTGTRGTKPGNIHRMGGLLQRRGQFPADRFVDLGHQAPPPKEAEVSDEGGWNWLHFESLLRDCKDGVR